MPFTSELLPEPDTPVTQVITPSGKRTSIFLRLCARAPRTVIKPVGERRIERDQIVQAKGHRYSTTALLGGDAELAAPFAGGQFATLYLSPRDYHRIHMPCTGRLVQMLYVPGALFSVNPATARAVPGLFARNERVVCHFESAHGPFALVLVGATIVGSMATVWHGVVNPPRSPEVRRWRYDDDQAKPVKLRQGEEMGRFLLGSTVVVLWPRGALCFNPAWAPGRTVRMGEAMGDTPSPS